MTHQATIISNKPHFLWHCHLKVSWEITQNPQLCEGILHFTKKFPLSDVTTKYQYFKVVKLGKVGKFKVGKFIYIYIYIYIFVRLKKRKI